MANDFKVTDLQLFLDTHPTDQNAIKAYNEARKCAKKAREKYVAEFGPLCKLCDCDCDGYVWTSNVWPWQTEFNTGN